MRRVLLDKKGVYHCMSRVCRGSWLMGEVEKEGFRKQMWKVAEFCGVEILTYCVMNNHFHVLVRVPEKKDADKKTHNQELLRRARGLYGTDSEKSRQIEMQFSLGGESARRMRDRLLARMHGLSWYMRLLKQRMSIWHNRRSEGFGTLWAERFKSVLVEDVEHCVTLVAAYIDLNPVRGGVCEDPKDYRWSGYGEAVGVGGKARRGLRSMFREGRRGKAMSIYRSLLFGTGLYGKGRHGLKGKAISPEKVKEVLGKRGELNFSEVLRCRVRYMSEGGILGTKGFLDSWVEEQKKNGLFAKRQGGGREMRGADWGGMVVLRDLQKDVIL